MRSRALSRTRGLARSAALAAGLAIALGACAVNPPAILSLSHRLIVAGTAAGTTEERLSFFAAVSDKDGAADLDRLVLAHDGGELYWSLGPDDWLVRQEGSRLFIGSNGLKAPAGEPLPRGRYRVMLYDLAGEAAEGSFELLAPAGAPYALPTVAKAGPTSVLIAGPYPSANALFLDTGLKVIKAAQTQPGLHSLTALYGGEGWREAAAYLAVYAYDPRTEIGFLSWIQAIDR